MTVQKGNISVFIFRLGPHWLALPTYFLKEVTTTKTIVSIPHKTNSILLGIANLNGELRLCTSIHVLLGLQPSINSNRMIVIAKENEIWAFFTDEIEGIVECNSDELKKNPFSTSYSLSSYLVGEMKTSNGTVGLLDVELLFSALQRSLT